MAILYALKSGSSGPQVEMLQLALKRAGFLEGNIDGIFGPLTQKSVKNFQSSQNLSADGIVGPNTWRALEPYLTGYITHTVKKGDTFFKLAKDNNTTIRAIETANPGVDPMNLRIGSKLIVPLSFNVVPNNIRLTSALMEFIVSGLKARYPFLTVGLIGRSVMKKPIYYFKVGTGSTQVFYNGAHHANEWITSVLLLTYLENYATAYIKNEVIGGEKARDLYSSATLYMVPLVNPDGVDLVTENLTSGTFYENAVKISRAYSQFPFPSGWKANIRGTDLNLQYPAGWENAREIKFAQGITSPAPRDYVGISPLIAPESRAVYDFTLKHDFALTLSYHSQGQVIYWRYLDYMPPCAETIGTILSSVSGYTLETTPAESGYAGYKDWFIYNYLLPGYTIEVGMGTSPLPLSQFPEIYKDNVGILSKAQALAKCQ